MDRISAIILAGGQSTRFGDQDKALAHIDGTPMIRHVADRLGPAADELVVNCRDGQRAAITDALTGTTLDPRFAVDDVPDQGPVYGLRTALRVAAGRHAVVVACDMPDVDPALLDALCERARETDHPAVCPRLDGRLRHLPGVYDVERTREACETAVARDERRLTAVLDRFDAHVLTAENGEFVPTRAVSNVNTPADIDAGTPNL